MMTVRVIPFMPQSSNLALATREVGAAFLMAGPLYLPWMSGVLKDYLGEGYWLLFTQRLPISYNLGDCLYGLMRPGQLPCVEEDAKGRPMEDTIEEETL